MPNEESGKVAWFLAGTAVGAAVALLYAPKSGKETRRYLGKKTEEGCELISETGKEIADRGKELYEKGRKLADEAAEMIDRGKKLVHG